MTDDIRDIREQTRRVLQAVMSNAVGLTDEQLESIREMLADDRPEDIPNLFREEAETYSVKNTIKENTKTVVETIHQLNIKKGDVLVLRCDMNSTPHSVLKHIKRNVHQVIPDIPILIIPTQIGVEVIRLEEWFV